jgi:hypothetical protein
MNYDGFIVNIYWTYDFKKGPVCHISNISANNVANGIGNFKENGDLEIRLSYGNTCETCYRIHSYQWKSENEFFFGSTLFKDDYPPGDFYGSTFIRKK